MSTIIIIFIIELKNIFNQCNNKRQSMNTWYERTLTGSKSRLYQFNFK